MDADAISAVKTVRWASTLAMMALSRSVGAAADTSPAQPPTEKIDATTVEAPRDRAAIDMARATRIEINNYRALSSIIAIVDTRRMKDVSFGQVAAYVAMIGLAQIRPEADVTDAPTILNLFSVSAKAPSGLTNWEDSFLKAVYQTRSTDREQIAAIKTAMVQDVAP